MGLAEELLNDLTHGSSEDSVNLSIEGRIVIGNDRFITIPEELKRIAVQYDHNIETVTFDCPRYWDDHDLTTMKIYVNYLRADNKPGSYLIKTITIDENDNSIIHFDWTIERDVTEEKGDIVFLVCAKKTNNSGNEETHWNTELCKDAYVSEGLECHDVIVREYPDIITHILTQLGAGVEGVTSWNDLEDKPFGEEYVENEFFNGTLNFANGVVTKNIYSIEDFTSNYLTIGTTYKVNWNGIEHECVAMDGGDTYVYIGSQQMSPGWSFPTTVESDEPFFISTSKDYYHVIASTVSKASVTIEVIEMAVGSINKLDEKFIPDSIARKEYVNGLYERILDGESDDSSKLLKSTIATDTLTWDGNTEGLQVFDMMGDGTYTFYPVSENVITLGDLENGVTIESSSIDGVTTDEIFVNDYARMSSSIIASRSIANILFVLEDNATLYGNTIPKKGIYFLRDDAHDYYISRIEITGYTDFNSQVEVLKKKYMPEDYATKEEFNNLLVQIDDLKQNGTSITKAMSESLWSIIQKTNFTEQLTDAELTAFKSAWEITDDNAGGGE